MSRRGLVASLFVVLLVVLVALLSAAGEASRSRSDTARAGWQARDDTSLTPARLDALAQAKANGTFGGNAKTATPATGWVGSTLLNASTDDWEPAMATDPSAPYVYLLTTRYGTPPPGCSSHCPSPFIALTTSADDGSTWSAQRALCTCLGSHGQFDPTIEVVPDTGDIYSAFL